MPRDFHPGRKRVALLRIGTYFAVDLIKSYLHKRNMYNSFTALADPTRRRIVEALSEGPLSSGEIASLFAISAPAISQHLKTLRQARLVLVHIKAQRRVYELDRRGIDEMGDWVSRIRRYWETKLDALQAQLEKDRSHE